MATALYQQNELWVYNSLTGKKERFVPTVEGRVGMYVCGPTVYSNVHLGNCRTFMSFDMIFRYFTFLGYKVRYVRNITDAGHLENDADQGLTDALIGLFIEERNAARAARDWALSDRIRDRLAALGIALKDGKDGTTYSIER